MPMIAKAPLKGATKKKGMPLYGSPIGPDKDPGTQASKMRKFAAAYEAALEAGKQGLTPEQRKGILRAHMRSAQGTPGGTDAVLEGMVEGTYAHAGKKPGLKKIKAQARRATKAYLG